MTRTTSVLGLFFIFFIHGHGRFLIKKLLVDPLAVYVNSANNQPRNIQYAKILHEIEDRFKKECKAKM
jgi:hypothetical protein